MQLFFRNDDLGWNKPEFDRLLNLFIQTNQKLNAAAIPSVCAEAYSESFFDNAKDYLQVHAHGYAHLDYETQGKKCEFGLSRNIESVQEDLKRSFQITSKHFSKIFYPAFTPPWNRMAMEYIPLLKEVGFKALSRDGHSKIKDSGLEEINVNIDLHTQKKPIKYTVSSLWEEVQKQAKIDPQVGIMLHHKHMTESDFEFLKDFLEFLNQNTIKTYFYSELVNKS